MYFLQASKAFDLKQLLMGSEDWNFVPEIILRTIIMFIVILVSLRLLGKRGVKQLSVFELVVIIGLGSAAGDPMFYKEVGLVPAIIVFFLIVTLYSFITHLVGKSKKFERIIESKPVYLIQDGVFAIKNFRKETLGEDEFFAELRMEGVTQLGQVETAIVESSGSISVFYYEEERVQYGLPILPHQFNEQLKQILVAGHYSCSFCGHTLPLQPVLSYQCPSCKRYEWVRSSNKRRIT